MENYDLLKLKEFKEHKIHHRYFEYERTKMDIRRKYQYRSWMEYGTEKGRIESNLWYKQARDLINKYDEQEIFKRVLCHCKNLRWLKSDKEIEEYALEVHISRWFENPKWAGFEDWKRESDKYKLCSMPLFEALKVLTNTNLSKDDLNSLRELEYLL